ncbi:MAG: Rieske 2Fe-2S domain-containing protein [Gemmataceae bacterium]|nr:Rieske 2Fe-2S domain-containing protein [Gemmataceae bacterium]
MAVIDHWHPVLLSATLRREPKAVRVDGHDIVVFRTSSGSVAALDEVCPHRRMKLSLGCVVGDTVQCKYHGWTFAADGRGESPGTPKLHACATSYDARDDYGAVWVRRRGADTEFPQFDRTGYHPMGVLAHRIKAPLELVVDNFTEIEHTPTTHGIFGYPLELMPLVKVTFEATNTSVRTVNVGPSKPLPWILRKLVGIKPDDQFIDDWTTWFSPVYSRFDHEWGNPETGTRAKVGWRLFIVWTPVGPSETIATTFSYARSTYPGPSGGLRLFKWLMQRLLDREIGLDVAILEGLASHETGIEGMKLSRFDRSLGLNRDRIETVYRGHGAKRLSLAG